MSSHSKKERKSFPYLYLFLVGTAFLVLAASYYEHRISDDFVFMVETACDPDTQICYVRDCEEEYCPPNGLSVFRTLTLPAKAFEACSDNSCANICLQEHPEWCEEIICDPTAGEACTE